MVEDEQVDTGNPTALGRKALDLELEPGATLVVHGMDGHVNFIHHPQPLKINVIDVVPPTPAKIVAYGPSSAHLCGRAAPD